MTLRRCTALLLAAGAALCAAPVRVGAHEEVPGIRAVLDEITPPLPAGVTVQVRISAADQLIVENTTDVDLEVLGSDGELLFRIGRAGVLANLRSPDWYRSANPGGIAEVPPDADPSAPPRLARVSRDPSWGWFDHRLHEETLTRAPDTGGRDSITLETWEIPMRYGGDDVAVRGHREYQVRRGRFDSRIESAPPELDVTVLPGPVPGLFATATGAGQVELLGAAGEPFARFDGQGVEVNVASPTWALTAAGRSGAAPPDDLVGVSEEPRWHREGSRRQLTWLEQRAVYEPGEPPDEARTARTPTDLLDWEVAVRVDGRPGRIHGVTSWVPATVSGADAADRRRVPGGVAGDRDERSGLVTGGLIAAAAVGATVALWQLARLLRPRRRPR